MLVLVNDVTSLGTRETIEHLRGHFWLSQMCAACILRYYRDISKCTP